HSSGIRKDQAVERNTRTAPESRAVSAGRGWTWTRTRERPGLFVPAPALEEDGDGSCRIVTRQGGRCEALRRGRRPSGRHGGGGRIEPRRARRGEERAALRAHRNGFAGLEVLRPGAGHHPGGAAAAGTLGPGHDAVVSGERR